MFHRFSARAACVALAVLWLSACGRQASPQAASTSAVPVTTQVVRAQPWHSTVQSIATARARESVGLTTAVSDVVERVHFESGDRVRAGQLLLTLRGQAQQAALEEAQAAYLEADRLYTRQQQLAGQQLIARASLDTQKAIRDAALARVQQMRSEIGDRQVRAPFAGVLGIRQISPGSLVTANTVIATLDDIARMHVDFQVPEAQLAAVQLGDAVTGTAAAYPGQTFEGRVSAIDARIDEATRAVTVRADFDNPGQRLRPGMLLDVRLFQPERQALVIPEIAVVQVGRESFVYWVLADGSVERADVRTGERRDGKVEIVHGLADGQRIVVDGTGKLRPGLKVRDGSAPQAATARAPR